MPFPGHKPRAKRRAPIVVQQLKPEAPPSTPRAARTAGQRRFRGQRGLGEWGTTNQC